jgi:hypothetical protein
MRSVFAATLWLLHPRKFVRRLSRANNNSSTLIAELDGLGNEEEEEEVDDEAIEDIDAAALAFEAPPNATVQGIFNSVTSAAYERLKETWERTLASHTDVTAARLEYARLLHSVSEKAAYLLRFRVLDSPFSFSASTVATTAANSAATSTATDTAVNMVIEDEVQQIMLPIMNMLLDDMVMLTTMQQLVRIRTELAADRAVGLRCIAGVLQSTDVAAFQYDATCYLAQALRGGRKQDAFPLSSSRSSRSDTSAAAATAAAGGGPAGTSTARTQFPYSQIHIAHQGTTHPHYLSHLSGSSTPQTAGVVSQFHQGVVPILLSMVSDLRAPHRLQQVLLEPITLQFRSYDFGFLYEHRLFHLLYRLALLSSPLHHHTHQAASTPVAMPPSSAGAPTATATSGLGADAMPSRKPSGKSLQLASMNAAAVRRAQRQNFNSTVNSLLRFLCTHTVACSKRSLDLTEFANMTQQFPQMKSAGMKRLYGSMLELFAAIMDAFVAKPLSSSSSLLPNSMTEDVTATIAPPTFMNGHSNSGFHAELIEVLMLVFVASTSHPIRRLLAQKPFPRRLIELIPHADATMQLLVLRLLRRILPATSGEDGKPAAVASNRNALSASASNSKSSPTFFVDVVKLLLSYVGLPQLVPAVGLLTNRHARSAALRHDDIDDNVNTEETSRVQAGATTATTTATSPRIGASSPRRYLLTAIRKLTPIMPIDLEQIRFVNGSTGDNTTANGDGHGNGGSGYYYQESPRGVAFGRSGSLRSSLASKSLLYNPMTWDDTSVDVNLPPLSTSMSAAASTYHLPSLTAQLSPDALVLTITEKMHVNNNNSGNSNTSPSASSTNAGSTISPVSRDTTGPTSPLVCVGLRGSSSVPPGDTCPLFYFEITVSQITYGDEGKGYASIGLCPDSEPSFTMIKKTSLFGPITTPSATASTTTGNPIPFAGPMRQGSSADVQSMLNMPGWQPGSVGYVSRDGERYRSIIGSGPWVDSESRASTNPHGKPVPPLVWSHRAKYSSKYGPGDTVGCGWNQNDGTVFFTLNGEYLGVAFHNVFGRMVPSACIVGSTDTSIVANFGQRPFVFDIEPLIHDATTVQTRANRLGNFANMHNLAIESCELLRRLSLHPTWRKVVADVAVAEVNNYCHVLGQVQLRQGPNCSTDDTTMPTKSIPEVSAMQQEATEDAKPPAPSSTSNGSDLGLNTLLSSFQLACGALAALAAESTDDCPHLRVGASVLIGSGEGTNINSTGVLRGVLLEYSSGMRSDQPVPVLLLGYAASATTSDGSLSTSSDVMELVGRIWTVPLAAVQPDTSLATSSLSTAIIDDSSRDETHLRNQLRIDVVNRLSKLLDEIAIAPFDNNTLTSSTTATNLDDTSIAATDDDEESSVYNNSGNRYEEEDEVGDNDYRQNKGVDIPPHSSPFMKHVKSVMGVAALRFLLSAITSSPLPATSVALLQEPAPNHIQGHYDAWSCRLSNSSWYYSCGQA